MPIGIFDSGLGGLTVVRSVRKELPGEDIVYFGDTARVPYGNKSRETIKRFSSEIMTFMEKKGVKVVIVACNTASSLSLLHIKNNYDIPVIGVIKPGVAEAVQKTVNNRIGVIGTKSTIESGSYFKEISKHGKTYHLFSESCPLFVPLVENGEVKSDITLSVAKKYLSKIRKRNIDTLILGCTHYPVLKTVIRKIMRKTVLIDSSSAVARDVKKLLKARSLLSEKRKRSGEIKCYVSDDVKGFIKNSRIFLKEKIIVYKEVLKNA